VKAAPATVKGELRERRAYCRGGMNVTGAGLTDAEIELAACSTCLRGKGAAGMWDMCRERGPLLKVKCIPLTSAVLTSSGTR
jgi:hypothetical protein